MGKSCSTVSTTAYTKYLFRSSCKCNNSSIWQWRTDRWLWSDNQHEIHLKHIETTKWYLLEVFLMKGWLILVSTMLFYVLLLERFSEALSSVGFRLKESCNDINLIKCYAITNNNNPLYYWIAVFVLEFTGKDVFTMNWFNVCVAVVLSRSIVSKKILVNKTTHLSQQPEVTRKWPIYQNTCIIIL